MTQQEKNFVADCLYRLLLPVTLDAQDTIQVVKEILEEVCQDITGTADHNNWNSNDIQIALARQIKKHICDI